MDDLRIMTCIELYLNAHYYCKHPCFLSTFSEHSSTFSSLESMLCISVSDSEFNTGLINEELVKAEAYHNFKNLAKWSGFLSILALSSVTGMKFFSHYPDCGLLKYKLLFNQAISARMPEKQSFHVHILFCYEGNLPVGDFRHNHYVPLIFEETASTKRKSIFTSRSVVKKECIIDKSLSSTAQQAVLTDLFVSKSSTKEKPIYRPSTSLFSFFKNNHSQSSCSPSKPNTSSTTTQPLVEEIPVFSAASATTQKSGNSCSLSSVKSAGNKHSTDTSLSSKVGVSLSSKVDDNTLSNAISSPCQKASFDYYRRFDVSFFRDRVSGLRDDEIYDMVKSVFVPSEQYSFPKSGSTGRHFRHVWLKDHQWLCYSVSCDGAFCLPCVIFGNKFPGKVVKIRKLFTEPVTYWNDDRKRFKEHEVAKNGLHQDTMLVFNNFISQMSGKTQPINVIVDGALRKEIVRNRQLLVPIIDYIIFCGRTNIALRGHRDDSRYHPDVGHYFDGRVGNFIELLNFGVRRGDKVLEGHLKQHQKNASYTSKTTQNKLITRCETIVAEIKKNKFYSILADETCDSAMKEQLSLVIRYVDSSNNVKEDFLRFIHCKEGLSGKDLSSVLITTIKELKLDIMNCRGQCYDGAGAVAGHINGLSACILRYNSKALCTHCHSHRLNLCVSDSCKVQSVRNIFDKIKEISYFFNYSETRRLVLEKKHRSA